MELREVIYRRKSTRSYTGKPVDEATLKKITDFCAQLKPLYPGIKVHSEMVESDRVRCILPWTTPQSIAIFSEETGKGLLNVGFMYQQLDLYLQSLGLGSCWLGMGTVDKKGRDTMGRDNGLKFIILIAFGYPKENPLRDNKDEFKRKPLAEISDREDERLEAARIAPSSVNSQPWYFTHEGDMIHVYCTQQGFLKKKALGKMNCIDVGIALAHLYIENPDTFRFFRADAPGEVPGYKYAGSVTL